MHLELVTPPAAEPITLGEALEHLRVDTDDDSSVILRQMRACRELAESFTRRQFITATWDLSLDGFPSDSGLRLGIDGQYARGHIIVPRPPLQQVSSIKYIDADGVEQTWAAASYVVETAAGEPGRIFPAYGESWPTCRSQRRAVTVRFIAGYGDAPEDVPECIREAILMMLAARYQQRSAVTVPAAGPPVYTPGGWRALLGSVRCLEVG